MGRRACVSGTVSRAVRDAMQMRKSSTRMNSHGESSRELFAEDKFRPPPFLDLGDQRKSIAIRSEASVSNRVLFSIPSVYERFINKKEFCFKIGAIFLPAYKSAFCAVQLFNALRRDYPEYLQLLRDVAEEVSASLPQQTLKTTFMLWLVHRPPIRLWRSSLDEVLMK